MRPRAALVERRHQLGPQRVAGMLAGDDEQAEVAGRARKPFSRTPHSPGPVAAASATAVTLRRRHGMLPGTGRARPRAAQHVLVGRQRIRRPGNGNAGQALRAAASHSVPQRLPHRAASSARHTSTPSRRLRRMPHCRSAPHAIEHGRDASRPPRSPGCRRGPRPRPNRSSKRPSRATAASPLSMSIRSRAAGRSAPHRHALHASAAPARPGSRCPALAKSFHGATLRIGGAHGVLPIEHQHGTGLDRHARQTRGRAQARRCADRWPACRRAVPARAWDPWSARRGAPASPAPRSSAATRSQHGVGALRTLDRQHLARRPRPPPGRHRGARAPRGRQSRARRRHGPARRGATAPICPASASRSGATSCAPRTVRPLASKNRTTRRQHGIIAARQQAEHLRQAGEEARIRPDLPQVRPPHAAGDDQFVARPRRAASPPCGRSGPSSPRYAESARCRDQPRLRWPTMCTCPPRATTLSAIMQRQPPAAGENAEPGHGSGDRAAGPARRGAHVAGDARRSSRARHAERRDPTAL